ncbi:MAG: hypothetical protein K2W94_09255 [Alphaproteobacteria bacterium]|nr:hypothetical protein [Alphaproteobacteria bacterium]
MFHKFIFIISLILLTGETKGAVVDELVPVLKRALTHSLDLHHALKPDFRGAFYLKNWLSRWVTPHPDNHGISSLASPTTKAPIEECHRIMAERFEQHSASFKSTHKVGYHAPRFLKAGVFDQNTINAELAKRIAVDRPFVTGQILPIIGKTNYAMSFLNLREKDKGKLSPKPIIFGAPLEHGFFFKTLEEYLNYIAILRDWGCYSHLSIVSIPANTEVNLRVGLIGPQVFPKLEVISANNTFQIKDNEDVVISRWHTRKLGCNIEDIKDHRHGGDMQVMMGYAEKYTVYDYGSLCKDQSGNPIDYLSKDLDGHWARPTNLATRSHYLDPDYLQTPFILEDILRSMGVIYQPEYDEIKSFIQLKVRK